MFFPLPKIDRYRREAEEARTIAQEKEQLLERARQEGQIETEKVGKDELCLSSFH